MRFFVNLQIFSEQLFDKFNGNFMTWNGAPGRPLFKVNNRTAAKRCEICSKLTIKTPKQRHWHHSAAFIITFEHMSTHFSRVSIVDFEQVNVSWIWHNDYGPGFLIQGSRIKNHWVAPRSTQSFILPKSISWVPVTPGNWMTKSNLSTHNGSLRKVSAIHKRGHKVFKVFKVCPMCTSLYARCKSLFKNF